MKEIRKTGKVRDSALRSGMTRGDIINLERKDVDIKSRIIKLVLDRTKDNKFKVIRIHKELIPFF